MRFFGILILTILIVSSSQFVWNETRAKGRIIGQDAVEGQIPYAVLVEVFYKHYYLECTGAFIGPTWILTSAKCIDGLVYAIVYLGSIIRHSGDVAYFVYPPEDRIHPLWNVHTGYNDIALMRIPKTDICYNIFPVPLPEMNSGEVTYGGHTAIASGWSSDSPELQWVRVTIMTKEECATARGYAIDNFICAYSEPPQCSGRAFGGPLISESAGILIGVNSDKFEYNELCIVVYTRVSSYLTWIKGVTGISY